MWYIKVQIFRVATGHIKIHQIPHFTFGNKRQFFFKLWTLLSVMKHNSFLLFDLTLYMLWAKGSSQGPKFCITLQCHDT